MKIALILAILAVIGLVAALIITIRAYRRRVAIQASQVEEWRTTCADQRRGVARALGNYEEHPAFQPLLMEISLEHVAALALESWRSKLGTMSLDEAMVKARAFNALRQIILPEYGNFPTAQQEVKETLQTARQWMDSGDPAMALDALAKARQARDEAEDIETENAQLAVANAQLQDRVEKAEALVQRYDNRVSMIRCHLINNLKAWGLVAELVMKTPANEHLRGLRNWVSLNFFTSLRDLERYDLQLSEGEFVRLVGHLQRNPLREAWMDQKLANLARGDNALAMLSRWFSGGWQEAEERSPDQVLVNLPEPFVD